MATDSPSSTPGAVRTFDVGTVLRKSFELIGNRPGPMLGAAAIAQLPMVVATLAIVPFVAPLAERMQRAATEGAEDPMALLDLVVDQLAWFVGLGLALMVVMYAFYAVQMGAVMQVAVDAYRSRTSSIGASLRAGFGRAASLFVFVLAKQLLAGLAFLVAFVLLVLPLAALPDRWSGREVVSVLAVLAASFVGVAAAFAVWSMLSPGAGAIVAERIGPFAGLARGLRLARAQPWTLALTWLAVGCFYLLGLCIVGCFSGMITTPIQLTAGSVTSAIVGQLIQFVPQVAMTSVNHTVGAIVYGELAGLDVRSRPEEIVDVFR